MAEFSPVHVQQRLIAVASAAMADDDEKAHILEDELFIEVLTAIAGGASNAPLLAQLALKSCELKFSRWHS